MDALAAAGGAGVVGVVIGLALSRLLRSRGPLDTESRPSARRPRLDRALIDTLPLAFVVLGPGDDVLLSNTHARSAGFVKYRDVVPEELSSLISQARAEQEAVHLDYDDGRRFWRASAVPFDEERIALIAEDRTEARRVEAVRRDFVANVGHELKTPVGALSLLAEAVSDAAEEPQAVRSFAGRMQRESERLTRLVRDVIDLSRLQAVDPGVVRHPVDLGAVVREAVDGTRQLADARSIEIAVEGSLGVHVDGDEDQLVTALSNLLSNAVAYSAEGTRIGVCVSPADEHVELSVTDQGIGIPPTEQERIFERFYRVDPARSRETGGTGLGLAIVKHVATGHGGEVSVSSRQGSGSTFTIRLPISRSSTVAAAVE